MRLLNSIKLKIFLRLYDNLYNQISHTAIKLNNGVHPKVNILKYHEFFRENVNEDSKVLDIGSGIGFLTYKVAQKAKKIVGIEINKKSVQYAQKHFNQENISYIHGDATKYNFEEKFDFIILSNVLEHIQDRIDFLRKIKDLSNFYLIRVPMINRSWIPIYKKQLGLEYRLDLTHYVEYTLESFQDEIEKVGLEMVSYSIQFGEIWAKIKKK